MVDNNSTDETARLLRPPWRNIRPPENARCAGCGSDDLAPLAPFSTGSGVASRPTTNAANLYSTAETDPRFAALRTNSEFQKLMAEFKAPGK